MITMSELRRMTRHIKADVPVNVSMRMPDGTVVIGDMESVSYDNFSGFYKLKIEAVKTEEFKGSWVFYPDVRITKLESVAQAVSMMQGVPVSADLAAAAKEAYQIQYDTEGGAK